MYNFDHHKIEEKSLKYIYRCAERAIHIDITDKDFDFSPIETYNNCEMNDYILPIQLLI